MSKPTKAQITANRRNCQKSTGPCTPQGKAVVSQNAVKHGLTAAQNVIKSEDQAEFDLHRSQIIDEWAPSTPTESFLAERIVNLSWKLRRIEYIQNQTINSLATPKTGPLTNMTALIWLKCNR